MIEWYNKSNKRNHKLYNMQYNICDDDLLTMRDFHLYKNPAKLNKKNSAISARKHKYDIKEDIDSLITIAEAFYLNKEELINELI